MEKLQAAIEKARSQRNQDDVPQSPDEAVERQSEPAQETLQERWRTLSPILVPPRIAAKNRLVASAGGSDAGPYDMLRTRILQHVQSNGWKRVALVSPHNGCGKSTTAANLAFSFGRQSDLRTLIIDLDLRRAGLAKILGQNCTYSMGDILNGEVPFSAHGLRLGANVALGLTGRPARNPAEILQSRKAIEVLAEIEQDYRPDITIFDMPPLIGADDNFGFLKNVDCALLLAAAERTTIDQIDVAERQLAELTNVLGVVLNSCHFPDKAFGYGYGYE